MCSPGCSGTHSVDQAGLELRNSPACLPSAGIKGMCHHAQLAVFKEVYSVFLDSYWPLLQEGLGIKVL